MHEISGKSASIGAMKKKRIDMDTEQISDTQSSPCLVKTVNKDMILVKLIYLFWGGMVSAYVIYLNPFFVSIGIPRTKAGVLTGIPYAVSAVAAPMWGILTDYSGRQQFILVLLCVCSAAWVSSLPLIAYVVGEHAEDINNITDLDLYNNTNFKVISCNVSCLASYQQNVTSTPVSLDSPIINGDRMFYTFLAVMALGSVFFSCVNGYIDAILLKAIKASPGGATYGAQRLYGSVGCCIFTYVIGVLLEYFPLPNMSPFAVPFFWYPIFPVILVPMLLRLMKQHERWRNLAECKTALDDINQESINQKNGDSNIREELLAQLRKVDVIIFIITVFVAGLSFGMVSFLVFLINERTSVSKTMISLAFSVESLSNILIFPFTSILIRFLGGPIPTVIFSLLCYCIRHVLISFTTSYWMIVALQGLSGISFASMWCSFMEYVHEISPKRIETTMIVLTQSVYYGLGCFTCNTIGGVLYGISDATSLFRWCGVMCGTWACVLIVYYGVKHKQRQFKSHMVSSSSDDQHIDVVDNIASIERECFISNSK